MSERVPKIRDSEKPTFDAGAYSDRLQEGRVDPVPRPPALAFDKSKPSSIVSLAQYVRGKLSDTVNALTEFTASHELRLNAHDAKIAKHETRIDALEARPLPFGSGSG